MTIEEARAILNAVKDGATVPEYLVDLALEVTGDKPVSLTEGDEHE